MKTQILVVEDDGDAREVLCLVLRDAGYATTSVRSGEEAARILENLDFDLLLTDIQMEGGDGFELIANAKLLCPSMPIVVVSGRVYKGTVDVLSIARRLGASAILTKPFLNERLLECVESLLSA